MIKDNTKFLALALLLIVVLTTSSCDTVAKTISADETEWETRGEIIVDKNTQNDVQALMEILSMTEIDKTTANESVTRLRREGVESIASLRIIEEAEFALYETAHDINIMVEIINIDGKVFKASLSNSGQVCAIYPPDKGAVIYGMEQAIP